jgi:hypothetical protein
MHPQPPRLNLLSNGKVLENLTVQLRIRLEKFLGRATLRTPGLGRVIALFAGEEAVVGEEFAAVAGGENDLVPFAFLAAPVFKGAVLRVVDQTESDCFIGVDIGVKTAGFGGTLLGLDAQDASYGRANTVSADNQIVVCSDSIFEDDRASLHIDIAALNQDH